MKSLPACIYDASTDKWVAIAPAVLASTDTVPDTADAPGDGGGGAGAGAGAGAAGVGAAGGVATGTHRTLRVVTWNVWFDPHRWQDRVAAWLSVVRGTNADVICLQEMLVESIAALHAQSWVRDHYVSSDPTGHTLERYGVVTLVRRSSTAARLHSFELHEFPTRMGRNLVLARLEMPTGGTATVGNVHLESMESSRLRVEQLKVTFPALAASDNSVLVGDFNFGDDWRENEALDDAYADAWLVLKGGDGRRLGRHRGKFVEPPKSFDPGFTMPADAGFAAWRPDKVLVRSPAGVLSATDIRMLGVTPFEGECERCASNRRPCCPSDHYGLVCDIGVTVAPPA